MVSRCLRLFAAALLLSHVTVSQADNTHSVNVLVSDDLIGEFSLDGEAIIGGELQGNLWPVTGYTNKIPHPDMRKVFAGHQPIEVNTALEFAGYKLERPNAETLSIPHQIRYQMTMLSSRFADVTANSGIEETAVHQFVLNANPLPLTGAAIVEIDDALAKRLNNASLQLRANGAKSIIINLTSDRLDFVQLRLRGDFENPTFQKRVVWNAPYAAAIRMTDLHFDGSLLAPQAAVHLNRVTLHGNVAARSLRGIGHIRENHTSFGQTTALLR